MKVIAWASATSNRSSRHFRADWLNPIELVDKRDAERCDSCPTTSQAEMQALCDLLQARNRHLEIELAQARSSREVIATKYQIVSDWMIKNVKLRLEKGAIVGATVTLS